MLGNWNGYYKYDNEKFQKLVGYEKTNFTITIEAFENDRIKGSVIDDINSGGMKGKGEIEGEVHKGHIYFEKRMPFETLVIDKKGTRKITDKKHKPIIYKGELINDNVYKGTWEFNRVWGFIFGFIPIKYSPGKGTWEMKKE